MESQDNPNIQFPDPSISDWDRPFTVQELQAIDAIEAAFQSATSSHIKKRQSSPRNDSQYRPKPQTRRRLPDSIFGYTGEEFPRRSSNSFFLSPCQVANLKMRHPAMSFGGLIIYSRTAVEVEKAATELLKSIEAKKKETGQVTLGFDIEWRPTFRRGVSPGKAAVMQICGDLNNCHVMHIIHSGITPSLQLLLEDYTLPKVGVGIGNDAVKVFKDHNVSIKTVEDLSYLANRKLGGSPQRWSLGSLTEMLVSKQLQKPSKIQLGNWEADILSKEQLHYAATDAFASWYLYQALTRLPDVEIENDAAPSSKKEKENDAARNKSEELQAVPPK